MSGEAGPACQGRKQPCLAGVGAAGPISQVQLHLSALPTTATGKTSLLTLVICPTLHLAVSHHGSLFSSVSWSCCFVRSVARQAVFSLLGKCSCYSSNVSLCLKRIFCFLGRKQHGFSPFFSGAKRPHNCKYWSSSDLKTDEV